MKESQIWTREFSQISSFSAFPNPGGTQTKLSYQLAEPSTVQITVVDVLGRIVWQFLPDTQQDAGSYEVAIDLSQWTKGICYCQLSTENMIKTINLSKK